MRQSQSSQSKRTPSIEPDKLAVKASTLAKQCDCSKGTIYNLINRGELRAVKVGSELRIPMSEVRRFLEATAEQGNARP